MVSAAAKPMVAAAAGAVSRRTRAIISLALAAAVAVTYLPALNGEFLNWDDNLYVTDNPHIRALSWKMVGWAFTEFPRGGWLPLTWLSHAVDYRLYGLDPWGHHLTSVALHVANTMLVFAVFEILTGATWRSAAVAALFGLHPLHVESVAWVAERKDVLSTLFWLLAMAAYARYVRVRTVPSYLAVLATFVAGLLSKPMIITLPAVLLLLDYWPLKRLSWAALREKVPFFIVAALSAAWTFQAQRTVGAVTAIGLIALPDRVTNAIVSYVRYLVLTAWPSGLSPFYSHPAVETFPLTWQAVAGSAALLIVATAFAAASMKRRPYVAVGWSWYLITLLPVIGLVQIGGQAMADRYTYIPLLGIFVIVAWGIASMPIWYLPAVRYAGGALAALVLFALAARTWVQEKVWHDPVTLWTRVLEVDSTSIRGHYNMANWLLREGETEEAARLLRITVAMSPKWAEARHDLGAALSGEGRYAEAAAAFREALHLKPDFTAAQRHLQIVLEKLREESEGEGGT